MPILSIIIVSYNCSSELLKCLQHIGINEAFEIIVVDNFEQKENEIIKTKYPNLIWIQNSENLGFGKACNIGAGIATSDNLLFLNPDTVVTSNTLLNLIGLKNSLPKEYLVSCQQSHQNSHLGFPTLKSFLLFSSKTKFKVIEEKENIYIEPDWISGSFIMISKFFFNKIGKWTEDYFMYFEDVDLCKKAVLAGGKCRLYISETIEHLHGGSSRKSLEISAFSKFHVQRSKHIYVKKYFSGWASIVLNSFFALKNLILGSFFYLIQFLVPFKKIKIKGLLFKKMFNFYLNKTTS